MEQKIEEEGRAFNPLYVQNKEQTSVIQNQKTYSKIMRSSSMIQYQQVKIPQQEIIIKDPSQKTLINSIICPICLMTLPMPHYQCQQCNNSFCTLCIQDWWNKKANRQKQQCIFKCQNATFKKVKRSNTYIALFDTLQFKCNLCQVILPLSSYEKHKTKQCPQMQVQCPNKDCNKTMKRKDQKQHEQQCEYRLQQCRYCNKAIVMKNLPKHEQIECEQRTTKCPNQKCQELIKLTDMNKHIQICEFKQIECQWCVQKMIRKQIKQHQQKCQYKIQQCEWCQLFFKLQQYQKHKCQLKMQICRLCMKNVLSVQIKQHKTQCMFQHMIFLKQQNQVLTQQNAKLHYKVNQLQQLIEDTISNTQGKAMQVIKKIKSNEKKQLQKDLLRIDNSITSINKLHDQQYNHHNTKIKHIFGTSLCISCKMLQKKFIQMKQPLLLKRKQVLNKIKQIDSFNQTARG